MGKLASIIVLLLTIGIQAPAKDKPAAITAQPQQQQFDPNASRLAVNDILRKVEGEIEVWHKLLMQVVQENKVLRDSIDKLNAKK